MKRFDVISIGALLLDQIAHVDRFPAPEEEVYVNKMTIEHGGSAANTAVACARLGLSTGFIGAIGRDQLGSVLKEGLAKEGVDTSCIKIREGAPSGMCSIFIDRQGGRVMYAFSGAANLLQPEDIDPDYLTSSAHVHLADLKNLAPLLRAAELARSHGIKVSLNVGGLIAGLGFENAQQLLLNVDVLILSQENAEKLFGTREAESVIKRSLEAGISLVALTLGSEGCILATAGELVQSPALPVEPVDSTGASDAFSAGLIYGLLRGFPLEKCAKYANATAALCVSTPGARFKHSLRDVEELVSKGNRQRA